jgi:hypothetical protein
MATAAAHVTALAIEGTTPTVEIEIVCAEIGLRASTNLPTNLARPPVQVVADIKALVRNTIVALGGPSIIDSDIYLFGGPT